jgi:hypothetical protein
MILAIAVILAVSGAVYYAREHYGSLAAVKAELVAVEAKLPAMEAAAKAEVVKLVNALKAKLKL